MMEILTQRHQYNTVYIYKCSRNLMTNTKAYLESEDQSIQVVSSKDP
jgi:hypothetical protein